MHYKMVSGNRDKYFEFVMEVEKSLKEGWKLQGGVSTAATSYKDSITGQNVVLVFYTQAFTR